MKKFFKKNNNGFTQTLTFKSKRKLVSGFMMVEIVVATSIIIIVLLTTMSTVQKGITISHQSVHSSQAAFLLEEGAEAVRISRDNNWTNISGLTPGTNYYPTFSGGTWTLSLTPNQVGKFIRTVMISNVLRDATTMDISDSGTSDTGTKLITVNVSWDESGNTISKNLKFYISNIF